jgi:acyl carrier protein
MTRTQITEQVAEIMEDVFDLDELEYADALNADDIEEWDSLSNIRFVVAIEQKFGLRFSNKEIAGLDNVGQLVDLVGEKLAAA